MTGVQTCALPILAKNMGSGHTGRFIVLNDFFSVDFAISKTENSENRHQAHIRGLNHSKFAITMTS